MFDFGNVLVNFDYDIVFHRLAHKSPLTVAQIRQAIYHSPQHIAFERGGMTGREFYAFVVETARIRMTYRQFCDAWADMFWPEDPMLDLASELGKRYELFLLSNTNEIHYREFKRIPRLFRLIPRQGLSFQLGATKPDVEIYRRFLDRFDLRATESLFIDDLEWNVEGAIRAGMHALHHASLQATRQALAGLGVAVTQERI